MRICMYVSTSLFRSRSLYNAVAYIGLAVLLQNLFVNDTVSCFLARMSNDIGKQLEEEQKVQLFKLQNPGLVYRINQAFKDQNITSGRHRQKVFKGKFNKSDTTWEPWGKEMQCRVGLKVIRAILHCMPEYVILTKRYNGKHYAHCLVSTPELDRYIAEQDSVLAHISTTKPPCIEEPLPWLSDREGVYGGYHTNLLASSTPFIKERGMNGEAKDFLRYNPPRKHLLACNTLQSVPWCINQSTVEVVRTMLERGLLPDHLPSVDPIPMPEKHNTDGIPEDQLPY